MKVICIDNNGWTFPTTNGQPGSLTIGKIYEVLELNKYKNKYLIIVDDGYKRNLNIKRFRPYNREKNLEILKLDEY